MLQKTAWPSAIDRRVRTVQINGISRVTVVCSAVGSRHLQFGADATDKEDEEKQTREGCTVIQSSGENESILLPPMLMVSKDVVQEGEHRNHTENNLIRHLTVGEGIHTTGENGNVEQASSS